MQEDIATPLSEVIWPISHAPPCERGTPIVLRALVDAICLLQLRDPIDNTYEINCDALVFDKQKAFTEAFSARAKLPLAVKKSPVYSLKGCLREPNAPSFGLI